MECNILNDRADAVVMLTWSDWFTELRSNRYHYATRFSKLLPVIFVQPDLEKNTYSFEATSIPNITVLHISKDYDARQNNQLIKALLEKNIHRPILWIYNINFYKFISKTTSVLTIYHGTEDYLSPQSQLRLTGHHLKKMNRILDKCDLLINVSEGVAKTFAEYSTYKGRSVTVTNGCDYKFYTPLLHNIENKNPLASQPIAFYQGNIFNKLNYELLYTLASKMQDWQFRFCGKIVFIQDEGWEKLRTLNNVVYLGVLTPEEIRDESYKATAGIIPFTLTDWLIKRSFPLKAFEYLATGLPVVTVPIDALLGFSDVLLFAETADEFERALNKAQALRLDQEHLSLRLKTSAKQDYDLRFEQALLVINQKIDSKKVQTNATPYRHRAELFSKVFPPLIKLGLRYTPRYVKETIKQFIF